MTSVSALLDRATFTRSDVAQLLGMTSPDDVETIRQRAYDTLVGCRGTQVYFRGLIEFSNLCVNDCYYCGIRRGNARARRFTLTKQEIVDAAVWCAAQGYGSVVLQSGERREESFVAFVADCVRELKDATISRELPQGVGVTLSVGEQSQDAYERFFAAGAHRYLLRIETSSPDLYARLHPEQQSFERRLDCVRVLQAIGFQVGTGVMIGLPGQTIEQLADDVLFFQALDVDMLGMGPYLPHRDTPITNWPDAVPWRQEDALRLSLLMIAVSRLLLKDVNIAATTALQAITPTGREQGLAFGANIIMPVVTPLYVRKDYALYEGKPCLDQSAEQCHFCLEARLRAVGRTVGYNAWGDAEHFGRRVAKRKSEP